MPTTRYDREARKVYAWVLGHQQLGHVIVALEPGDLAALEANPALHGDREALVNFNLKPRGRPRRRVPASA